MGAIKKLVIIGGEGAGVIVANAATEKVADGAPFALKGFLNDGVAAGATIIGLPVLGPTRDWCRLPDDTVFIPALHNYKAMPARLEMIRALGVPSERWMTVCHPRSSVAADAKIGRGCFIGAFAVIEPGVSVGDFVFVRSGAYLSHDVAVGDFVAVGANSTILGRSKIGEGTFIGANAVVQDQITIGDFSTVGIGSVVVRSTGPNTVMGGNPARSMTRRFR